MVRARGGAADREPQHDRSGLRSLAGPMARHARPWRAVERERRRPPSGHEGRVRGAGDRLAPRHADLRREGVVGLDRVRRLRTRAGVDERRDRRPPDSGGHARRRDPPPTDGAEPTRDRGALPHARRTDPGRRLRERDRGGLRPAVHEPGYRADARYHAGRLHDPSDVVRAGASRRSRARERGGRTHRTDAGAVLDRVPDASRRRSRRVGPGPSGGRARRERRPPLLVGRDVRHHEPQAGGGGPRARAGDRAGSIGSAPFARRAEEHLPAGRLA